jgi:hypothetical protein
MIRVSIRATHNANLETLSDGNFSKICQTFRKIVRIIYNKSNLEH